MIPPNKLSHSKIKLFQECPLKYKFHYIDNIRTEKTSSALIFGSAIDLALNSLVINRDLETAHTIFKDKFLNIRYNGEDLKLKETNKVDFYESDYVDEILSKDERKSIADGENKYIICLLKKGQIILNSYYDYVLPRIKEVISCQERYSITNSNGDVLEGIVDLIAKLNDGKVYILDHKATKEKYDKDRAAHSPQLLIYKHLTQNDPRITGGLGFVIMNKSIWVKKIKTCSVCGFNGSGKTFRTCFNEIDGKRCDGKWDVDIKDPKCYISIILNTPNLKTMDRVLDVIDETNERIKDKQFHPNFGSCIKGQFKCPYYNLCYGDSMDGLIKKK